MVRDVDVGRVELRQEVKFLIQFLDALPFEGRHDFKREQCLLCVF
jgi:hypothetical protein